MSIPRLPNTASVDDVVASINEHGFAVIDELAPASVMDAIESELEEHIQATAYGDIPELGLLTRRTGSLIARSPTVRELVMNELVVGAASKVLSKASAIQLALTEMISLSPGAPAQFLHRDELLLDAYPFLNDYEVYCNTLWAVTDYTEEMGATRVVPGSHRATADAQFDESDAIVAEMPRGSVMIFSGKLFHGGGENKSNRERRALDLGYSASWVRQEENQFLACPPDIARTLPDDLLRLMGYRSDHGYGHPGDRATDPLDVLKG